MLFVIAFVNFKLCMPMSPMATNPWYLAQPHPDQNMVKDNDGQDPEVPCWPGSAVAAAKAAILGKQILQ